MEILLGEEVRGVIDTTARAPALARVLAVVGDDDVRVLSLDHLFVVCLGRQRLSRGFAHQRAAGA